MKIYPLILCSALFFACKSPASKESASGESNNVKEQPATAVAPQSASDDNDKVSFKVNGVLAQTAKKGKDREPHIGLLNFPSMQLALGLLGDDPARPHRGSLDIEISDFKLEPAKYTITDKNHVDFRRYETENAGGATSYLANHFPKYSGSNFTLEITKVEKNEQVEFGVEYRASGTFLGKLILDPLLKESDIKVVEITEGSFENVRISALGVKK